VRNGLPGQPTPGRIRRKIIVISVPLSPDSGRFPATPDDGRKLITQWSMNILNVNVACNHEPEHEYSCYEYPDSIENYS